MPRTSTVEPSGCPPLLRAICCDSLGFIKVVQVRAGNGAETGALDVVARWGQPGMGLGIVAMSYSNGTSNRLAIARKSGKIEVLDSRSGAIVSQFASPRSIESCDATSSARDESDETRGLHLFNENSTWTKAVLTCKENGDAAIQRFEDVQDQSEQVSDAEMGNVIARWDICKSGSILSMKVHSNEGFAAFGGKGVELNLWDLEKTCRVWEAKKPRRDNLGLISPAWVTASTFLSRDNHRKIVVGTGDHQVRLYDVVAQRRPVFSFDYGESPIKAVAEDPDGVTVYVGTGAGNMASFDMRTGRLLAGFKGKLAGSVRSIARHPSLPLIASCGLDRFLRIHDVTTKQLLGKVFLKQPLVGVVFDSNFLSVGTSQKELEPKEIEELESSNLEEVTPKSELKSKLKKSVIKRPGANGKKLKSKAKKSEAKKEENKACGLGSSDEQISKKLKSKLKMSKTKKEGGGCGCSLAEHTQTTSKPSKSSKIKKRGLTDTETSTLKRSKKNAS